MPRTTAHLEWVALGALCGNVLLQLLPRLPAGTLLGPLALLGVALLCRRASSVLGAAIVSFCLTGVVASFGIADRWPSSSGQADVRMAGWIDDFPGVTADRTVFTLRTRPAEADGTELPHRIRLTWYEPPFPLKPGMSVDIVARIRPPRGLANPGGFDYERWLLSESIGATGYVRSGSAEPDRRYGVRQAWLKIRADLYERMRAATGRPAAGALLAALALGIRIDFGDEEWRILRRTGTTHLVAISGLHVGLVAAFAFALLRHGLLFLPQRIARRAWPIAALLTLVPAVGYAALAGFSLPTLRALLMLLVAQCVILSRRRVAPLTGLSFALLIVLIADPLATLTASFWLSFTAVAAIVCSLAATTSLEIEGPKSRQRSNHWWIHGAVAFGRIQLLVGFGLMPLAARYFGEISLAGFIVNLVAVPVFSFVLVPVSLLIVMAAMAGSGTVALARIAEPLASGVWHVLTLAANWPFASVELSPPGVLACTVALAGAACLALLRTKWRYLSLLAGLALWQRGPERPQAGTFDMTVLDVGHGLAVIVRTASHSLIFDTGPLSRSGFDAGLEIVDPALRYLSPDRLDMIVISHGDNDHAGGLSALLSAHPGVRVLSGPDLGGAAGATCQAGQNWQWDGVSFQVLHPAPDFMPLGNDSSCVLRIDSEWGSALLTGDIERRAENILVSRGLAPASVVTVPHHGSATSSTVPFVRATTPAHAIVSAAFANRWNFPRPDIVSRWHDGGAEVITTAVAGAITARVSAAGVELESWRETHSRYWAVSSGTRAGSAL